ncbi:MAG TPA: anti-sigma factor, partial [Firmicutes bacterium]|nr:anti-sigma factor [Bacillota bacterium]
MRCSEVREHLSSYMDGMLSAELMQAVDEHLSLCPDCREELRQLEETVALLRNLGEVEPPADLRDGIINKIQ